MSAAVRIELRKRREPWKIWLFSDIHIGHRQHNASLWRKHYERAWEDDSIRGICLGDLLECVTLDSKVAQFGAMYEQVKSVDEQVDEAVTTLAGFKHLDASIEGNHDIRYAKGRSESVWQNVILPRVYGDKVWKDGNAPKATHMFNGGFVTYYCGAQEWTLCLNHGEGPVVNPATTLFRMALMFPGAQGYFAGHDHSLWVRPNTIQTPQGLKDIWFGRTGTYLGPGLVSYQERRILGVPPAQTGSVMLTLDPKGGFSDVEIMIT